MNIYELIEENKRLKEENLHLRQVVGLLEERVGELEKRLKKDSSTSSKPPSTDGDGQREKNNKRRTESGRKDTIKKPSGGQEGHTGNTLLQSEHPDHVVVLKPDVCPDCQVPLAGAAVASVSKRQVVDVQITTVVTEYQSQRVVCPCCQKAVSGVFPDSVKAPVQYGEGIKAMALYLKNHQMLPEDRLAQFFHDVLGLAVCDASFGLWNAQAYDGLSTFEGSVTKVLFESGFKHADETGTRVKGKRQWLHVLCNLTATLYRLSPGRKALPVGTGVVMHDGYNSYYTLENIEHALCNAHLMRELNALKTFEKEPWAWKMKQLLKIALALWKKNRDPANAPSLPKAITEDWINNHYDRVVQQALVYHEGLQPLEKPKRGRQKRRIGDNLAIRFLEHKHEVLRFLWDPQVPFTNNHAEQQLRMEKVRLKISGTFRSVQGAQHCYRIRSYLMTMRKQGHNVLTALQQLVRGNPIPLSVPAA